MSFKKNLTYVAGTLAALVLLSGLNIALPTTIKVTYAADGKPVADAFVVSYLAIRGGFHSFDGGQSLSQIEKTNAQGEASFGLDFTWVFMNNFQDYKSMILIYKPFYAPITVREAFNLRRPVMTIASPKVETYSVKPRNIDLVKANAEINSFSLDVGNTRAEKLDSSGLNKTLTNERLILSNQLQ